MAVGREQVPERLWREIEPLIPRPARRFRYPGRKRLEERACLEGILTVLRHGIPWRALPAAPGLPSGKTCWRRLDEWERAGVWPRVLERLQARLADAERIDWARAIVDASFVAAKRGARRRARVPPTAATTATPCARRSPNAGSRRRSSPGAAPARGACAIRRSASAGRSSARTPGCTTTAASASAGSGVRSFTRRCCSSPAH